MNVTTLGQVLEVIRSEGAFAGELMYSSSHGYRASAIRGRVSRSGPESSSQLTLRAWMSDGRVGVIRGAPEGAKSMARRVVERARHATPVNLQGPVGRNTVLGVASGIDDRRWQHITREDRLDVLVRAERAAGQVSDELEAKGFSYRDRRTERIFMNTKGITLSEFDTVFRLEGTVRSPGLDIELHEVIEDRSFASVASLPFGASMARRLKALEGEATPLDGPLRVMMPPRVTAAIFGLLAPYFTLQALQEERSFLARARQGGAAFDTKVHLLDDGRVTGALRTVSFDDRGVSPVPLTLIRDGVVSASYKGLVEARRRSQRASGHRRGEDLHPTNLLVRGGTRTMNALLSEQTVPVLRLDHIRGLQRGLDLQTGDIKIEGSGVLVHGRRKVIGLAPRVRLSGNLVDILRSVVELASDTDRFGHVDAPGMMVDGFTCKTR